MWFATQLIGTALLTLPPMARPHPRRESAPLCESRAPHHRCGEVFERRRAELLHRDVGLGAQNSEHAFDAVLTKGAEAPQVGPTDTHRLRAHGQRLDDVGAAAEATVDQHRHAAADHVNNFRQHLDRRGDAVLHPSTVVRDDDRVDTGIGSQLCVLEGKNTFEHKFDLDPVAHPLDQVPGQIGDDRAAHTAEVDAGKIWFARQIIVDAVTASAIARVGAP